VDTLVSAHAWSADGFNWTFSPVQPYTSQVKLSTGETITVSTRERPKLYFDKAGRMTHLFNGVCSAQACPGGPPPGCVDCKVAGFWDYTLVVALDTGEEQVHADRDGGLLTV